MYVCMYVCKAIGMQLLRRIFCGRDMLPCTCSRTKSVHYEGVALQRGGSELHYPAQLTVQTGCGIEYSGHHFTAAELALPTVDKPPANVPSTPRYHSSGLLCT